MNSIIVAGCGTNVGKTVVSAILTTLLNGDYWKPVQSGIKDSDVMSSLIDTKSHRIFPASYSLKAPISPLEASKQEGISIDVRSIKPPFTERMLIIESVGGIFAPLTNNMLTFDLFSSWKSRWVVVSRHYLGSINHTLLTLWALQQKNIDILGIVFNGKPNESSESFICEYSKLPVLGRILPEENINLITIQRYAKEWKKSLFQ